MWRVECSNPTCRVASLAKDIVDLLDRYIDNDRAGLFRCLNCDNPTGYVEKRFSLQEQGRVWEPFLRGAIRLASDANDTYQPFVFLVSYDCDGPINDCWFSYYKDLRSYGGSLKLGYGPGGPPVLGHDQIISLIGSLKKLGFVKHSDLRSLVESDN